MSRTKRSRRSEPTTDETSPTAAPAARGRKPAVTLEAVVSEVALDLRAWVQCYVRAIVESEGLTPHHLPTHRDAA